VRSLNLLPLPYRRVSVQDCPVPLTSEAIEDHLLGREAYRRTDYIVLRRAGEVALVQVERASDLPLFSPITTVRVLALPEECAWVEAPEVDTANPSQMARLAQERMPPGARGLAVKGRHEHVNFILDPNPLTIRVLDVTPPDPPKLLVQAQQVLDYVETLPAIRLLPEALDLRDVARRVPASAFVFPCRASGIDLDVPVDFLDQRPPDRHAVLVGCERSTQFYRHFYGREPERVDICPRTRVAGNGFTLLKCCLLERGLEEGSGHVIVPWGANLSEVAEGLTRLVTKAGLSLLAPPVSAAV
jgi:hypothetical protein